MATKVIIPDFGTSVDTLTLVIWLKEEGDEIRCGDPLCEIETDKAASELESFVDGILLRQVVEAGSEVGIGDTIAYIGKAGESVPDESTRTVASGETETTDGLPAEPVKASEWSGSSRPGAAIQATPKVRKLARTLGVDLASVVPSGGAGGKITENDVRKASGT